MQSENSVILKYNFPIYTESRTLHRIQSEHQGEAVQLR